MSTTTKIHPSGMKQDLKTGGFLINLTKADKEEMAKKNIVAMAADFSGHFCVLRVKKGKGFKTIEQPERFPTPQEAIASITAGPLAKTAKKKGS